MYGMENVKLANKSFESVVKFRYFGTTQMKIAFMKKLGVD
jgi:hypothetical protein